MQHSQRLSFYKTCRTKYSRKPDLCPKFEEILSDLTTKDYIDATTNSVDKNLEIVILYINNREETKYALDNSLLQLWLDYFNTYGYKNVNVKRMLDVYHKN